MGSEDPAIPVMPSVVAGSPDHACTEAVLAATRALLATAARSLVGHDEDVSLLQYRVLVLLGTDGPQRPIDLAQSLGVTASSASRLCERLVKKRLVTRRRRAPDRRSVYVALSSVGRSLLDDVMSQRRDQVNRILEHIPAQRRGELAAAFEEFTSAVRQATSDEAQGDAARPAGRRGDEV